MTFLEFAPIDFPVLIRKELIAENGPLCWLCNKFMTKNGLNCLTIHHIIPKLKNGMGFKENGMVCCFSCHKKLHDFLAVFELKPYQYKLFTAFYIHLFLPYVGNKKIYKKFPKYKSLNRFARLFKKYAKKQKKVNYMLLQLYIYHYGKYSKNIVKDLISSSFSVDKLKYQLEKYRQDNGLLNKELLSFANFDKKIKNQAA
jgi:hypothetical protein